MIAESAGAVSDSVFTDDGASDSGLHEIIIPGVSKPRVFKGLTTSEFTYVRPRFHRPYFSRPYSVKVLFMKFHGGIHIAVRDPEFWDEAVSQGIQV